MASENVIDSSLSTTETNQTTIVNPSTTTGADLVVETFNETEVNMMIDEFDGLGDDVYSSLNSMDSLVAESIQVASGGIAGKVGQVLYTEWSENCVPMLNFTRFFDGISESMRKIYNRSSETAEAIENIYSTTDPDAATVGSTDVTTEPTLSTTETPTDLTETGAEDDTAGDVVTVDPITGEQIDTNPSTEPETGVVNTNEVTAGAVVDSTDETTTEVPAEMSTGAVTGVPDETITGTSDEITTGPVTDAPGVRAHDTFSDGSVEPAVSDEDSIVMPVEKIDTGSEVLGEETDTQFSDGAEVLDSVDVIPTGGAVTTDESEKIENDSTTITPVHKDDTEKQTEGVVTA